MTSSPRDHAFATSPGRRARSRERSRTGRPVPALAAALVLGLSIHAADAPQAPSREPREIGLTEKATGQLAQLDVTVRGPRPAVAELTRDDFELVVGGKFLEEFLVDRVCQPQGARNRPIEEEVAERAPDVSTPAPSRAHHAATTFLFYFDQHHLNGTGRQRSLDLSRAMIPALITGGNRAMVVSAGQELATFSGLTDDVDELLDAVDRVEQDHKQWDFFPYNEHLRLNEVLRALSEDGVGRACTLASMHQKDEIFQTERALRRFALVLGRLAAFDPPKAVIYFADTMRSRPGEHYAAIFGSDPPCDLTIRPFVAAATFDRVIREAAAHGVRVYTVQAEGLVTDSMRVRGGPARYAWTPGIRVSDAQNSLAGLALETGGEAFLNGVSAKKMVRRIADDLDCLYLLSFDPRGFALDKPLPVLVRVKRPGIEVHARGTFVLQSEASRVTSRLLAAFATPEAAGTDWPLSGAIVPTGFRDGQFHALVQVAVPASPLPRTEWDLGFSLVARDRVREDASRRIAVDRPGVPLVFERELTFKPGPFELIAVAREIHADQVASTRIEAEWPDPDDAPACIGPLALLQPLEGAFLRGTELRASGARAVGEAELLRPELPTVVVGIVCRSRPNRTRLRVERRLVGDDSAEFPPIDLEPAEERCVQIRDTIPAGTMSPGGFAYEVRLLRGDEEVASARREFVATDSVAGSHDGPGGSS